MATFLKVPLESDENPVVQGNRNVLQNGSVMADSKTVLFVIDTLQIGGAEKSILEISSRFKTYSPVVCTLFSKDADLKTAFEERGVRVIELNLPSRFWLITGIRKLRALVEELDPALIHANLYKAEVLTRIAIGKSRLHIGSFVNDSYSHMRYRQQNFVQNMKLNIVKYIDLLTARNVPYFTSITDAIAKTNAEALGINRNKIVTIYRGRTINNYNVVHPGIEETPFTFLVVARLLKRKGYLDLIRAADILRKKGTEFRILVAGEGHDRKVFEDYVRELSLDEYFNFLGSRSDVPDLLKKCHCFVFPSHYEGQGGALVEAMLAGKPIIATRIDVLSEQVQDMNSGILFEIFNAEDLASKMLWVMDHYEEAKALGLNARRVAEKRFDINKIAEQHEELYTRLISLNENHSANTEAPTQGR